MMKRLFVVLVPAFLFFSMQCAAKAQEAVPSGAAPTMAAPTMAAPIMAAPSKNVPRAFAEAGIPVLGRSVDPVDFSLPLLGGGEAQLSAYKGKVVFLNFWATWCPPCRAEMPAMENLYKRLAGKGLEILAVDCAESREDVAAFVKAAGYTFPALLDENGAVSRRYGASAIPTTYILNREGKIIIKVVGSLRWDEPEIIAAFESLLEAP